ncbi:hypothetical protein RHSIM_Rhsim12G0078300 [Rhododendron simsii]|uniref:Uncharacterized protein n=1 Tax=Rhododendron simsii TaxID=118357 RepID=A0A834G2L5_RHOSS|nr:hypothetical protein RHSIM_Rhsim12G0078300 [Rhododendron simsii]
MGVLLNLVNSRGKASKKSADERVGLPLDDVFLPFIEDGCWGSPFTNLSFSLIDLPLVLVLYLLVIFVSNKANSITLWAISGQVLMEMVGHTSIFCSVDSHVSGLIVSSRVAVRTALRRYGKMENDFVWDVKFLENGDIVTACSDGVVHIWTVNNDKIADLSELESFASQLSHYKISRETLVICRGIASSGGLLFDVVLSLPSTMKQGRRRLFEGPDPMKQRERRGQARLKNLAIVGEACWRWLNWQARDEAVGRFSSPVCRKSPTVVAAGDVIRSSVAIWNKR